MDRHNVNLEHLELIRRFGFGTHTVILEDERLRKVGAASQGVEVLG